MISPRNGKRERAAKLERARAARKCALSIVHNMTVEELTVFCVNLYETCAEYRHALGAISRARNQVARRRYEARCAAEGRAPRPYKPRGG